MHSSNAVQSSWPLQLIPRDLTATKAALACSDGRGCVGRQSPGARDPTYHVGLKLGMQAGAHRRDEPCWLRAPYGMRDGRDRRRDPAQPISFIPVLPPPPQLLVGLSIEGQVSLDSRPRRIVLGNHLGHVVRPVLLSCSQCSFVDADAHELLSRLRWQHVLTRSNKHFARQQGSVTREIRWDQQIDSLPLL